MDWLGAVLRRLASHPSLELTTPGDYFDMVKNNQLPVLLPRAHLLGPGPRLLHLGQPRDGRAVGGTAPARGRLPGDRRRHLGRGRGRPAPAPGPARTAPAGVERLALHDRAGRGAGLRAGPLPRPLRALRPLPGAGAGAPGGRAPARDRGAGQPLPRPGVDLTCFFPGFSPRAW